MFYTIQPAWGDNSFLLPKNPKNRASFRTMVKNRRLVATTKPLIESVFVENVGMTKHLEAERHATASPNIELKI